MYNKSRLQGRVELLVTIVTTQHCLCLLSTPTPPHQRDWEGFQWPLSNITLFFGVCVCWVGVHCGIYKSSYNISYLNSPPPPFSFIPIHPFLDQFKQVSFFHLHIITLLLHWGKHWALCANGGLVPSTSLRKKQVAIIFIKLCALFLFLL
jgi:hypothetical protein